MRRLLSGCFAYVLMVLLATGSGILHAQSVRGSIAGNVADSSGAVIPGATISAVDQANGGNNVTKSTSAGSYRFAALTQ
jgi:hypothetical protein